MLSRQIYGGQKNKQGTKSKSTIKMNDNEQNLNLNDEDNVLTEQEKYYKVKEDIAKLSMDNSKLKNTPLPQNEEELQKQTADFFSRIITEQNDNIQDLANERTMLMNIIQEMDKCNEQLIKETFQDNRNLEQENEDLKEKVQNLRDIENNKFKQLLAYIKNFFPKELMPPQPTASSYEQQIKTLFTILLTDYKNKNTAPLPDEYDTMLSQYEYTLQLLSKYIKKPENEIEPSDAIPEKCAKMKTADVQFKEFLSVIKKDQQQKSPFRELIDMYKTVVYENQSLLTNQNSMSMQNTEQGLDQQKYDRLRDILDEQLSKIDAATERMLPIIENAHSTDFFSNVDCILMNYTKLQEENAKLKNELHETQMQSREQESQLNEANSELNRLNHANDTLQEQLKIQSENHKKMKAIIQKQLTQIEKTTETMNSINIEEKNQKRFEEINEYVNQLLLQIDQQKQSIDSLTIDNRNIMKTNDDLFKQVNELKQENKKLSAFLSKQMKSKSKLKELNLKLAKKCQQEKDKNKEEREKRIADLKNIQTTFNARFEEQLQQQNELRSQLIKAQEKNSERIRDVQRANAEISKLQIISSQQKEQILQLSQENSKLSVQLKEEQTLSNQKQIEVINDILKLKKSVHDRLSITVNRFFGTSINDSISDGFNKLDSLIEVAYKNPQKPNCSSYSNNDYSKIKILNQQITSLQTELRQKETSQRLLDQWLKWGNRKISLFSKKQQYIEDTPKLISILDSYIPISDSSTQLTRKIDILRNEKKFLLTPHYNIVRQTKKQPNIRTITLMLIFMKNIESQRTKRI